MEPHYCRVHFKNNFKFKIMLKFLNIRFRMPKRINFTAFINLIKTKIYFFFIYYYEHFKIFFFKFL